MAAGFRLLRCPIGCAVSRVEEWFDGLPVSVPAVEYALAGSGN